MTHKIILRWKEHNDLLIYFLYEKTCKYLNYIEHLVILVSTVTGCIYIFVFVSLACVPAGFNKTVVIKLCAIISGIKKYKSIITKKKKKHGRILLLGKSKLNSIEVLISESLIDSYTGQNEFFFSK